MKTIIISWFMFQLIIIGITGANIENQVALKTYKCPNNETVPVMFGALFPLAVFVPENSSVARYCNK